MVTAIEEIVKTPKSRDKPVLIPNHLGKKQVAKGFQQDNSIDLWVCTYEGVTQLSAFVYPTKMIIQYKMPLIDTNFQQFAKMITTREFKEIAVEELNKRFRDEAGTAISISHPIGLECYLSDGCKIYEHSFNLGWSGYVADIIRELK